MPSLYSAHCETCHRPDRKGVPDSGYPSVIALDDRMSDESVATIIERGKGRMTGFPQLDDNEKERLIAFLFDDEKIPTEVVSGPADEIRDIHWKMNGYIRFKDSEGLPGISPPWGTLTAIDLNSGEHKWQIPLGQYPGLQEKDMEDTGTPTYGGPLVTENGLLVIASTIDSKIRAFDKESGKLLWEHGLPFAGFATPSTYMIQDKQFVTVLCGGGKAGVEKGDAVMTFALP